MSASSTNLGNIRNFQPEEEKEVEKPNPFIKKISRQISMQHDHIKKEIFKKLNKGCVLNFLRNSERKDTTKTNCSETYKGMNYDLCMINKYDENLNSSLSFISNLIQKKKKMTMIIHLIHQTTIIVLNKLIFLKNIEKNQILKKIKNIMTNWKMN